MRLLWLVLGSCQADAGPDWFVLRGASLPGGAAADVEVKDGRIVTVGVVGETAATQINADERYVAAAFLDSHVHLTYLPLAEEMADGGVAFVVDLAAPVDALKTPPKAPRVLGAGPMITSVGGYPLNSWGYDGYGTPVVDAAGARAAVDALVADGAGVIKLQFEAPALPDDVLAAAVEQAHSHGLLVVAHALDEAGAAKAAALGVDGLAHTPVETLTEATVQAWSGRFVISTLYAFGTYPSAVENLRALRAAGVTVLYGTDFGNTRTPGIHEGELTALTSAGLDGAAILEAATAAPAGLWKVPDLGSLTPGSAASLLLLDADPTVDPTTLLRPVSVWIDGKKR